MLSFRSSIFTAALAALTASAAVQIPAQAPVSDFEPQSFDVAMDGTSFSFEGDFTPSGVPAKGTPFIVSGYLYPRGTFSRYGLLSGVHPDGSPEFPELVVGTWSCRGWHLQDGDAATGPVVATTQVFDFDPDRPGTRTIVTDGIELADFHVPFERAVTGGTGSFRRLRVVHDQTYVGRNETQGFNSVVRFQPES